MFGIRKDILLAVLVVTLVSAWSIAAIPYLPDGPLTLVAIGAMFFAQGHVARLPVSVVTHWVKHGGHASKAKHQVFPLVLSGISKMQGAIVVPLLLADPLSADPLNIGLAAAAVMLFIAGMLDLRQVSDLVNAAPSAAIGNEPSAPSPTA